MPTKLSNTIAIFIIAIVGIAIFFTGLATPFMGDDMGQIVNNPPVHWIGNIGHFFEGGTFYNGHSQRLSGSFYRPVMTTVFSLVYTLLGPRPVSFHIFQLLLCTSGAVFLYLFFRYSFMPALSLFLALVFLIHPLNSQVVFAIPSMQDALFFFFGSLALWLLRRFGSVRSLIAVAICLLLSLLSKETGLLFSVMALMYLFWFDRKRLFPFIGIMAFPAALYLALRMHAVGFRVNQHSAPIGSLSLPHRLLMVPAIVSFYLLKFIFPLKLAQYYHWTYPTVSISHFLAPLTIDVAVIALVIFWAALVRKRAPRAQFFTYTFFGAWSVVGLLPHLQLIPLDMTVCETWFHFSMAGVLGAIGVVISVLVPPTRMNHKLVFAGALTLLMVLGLRTAMRGTDWRDPFTLASRNIEVSREDYNAEIEIAYYLAQQGVLSEARQHADKAVAIYPTTITYNTLGIVLIDSGEYAAAKTAFLNGLKYGDLYQLYENLGAVTMWYGAPDENKAFLVSALEKLPENGQLWLYLAILDQRNSDNEGAKTAITNASMYGASNQYLYNQIMNNEPINIGSRPVLK